MHKHVIVVMVGLLGAAMFAADAHAMYQPSTGRWMQRDPLGVTVTIRADNRPSYSRGEIRAIRQYEDGANVYEYTRARPMNLVDAFGLSTLCGTRTCMCTKSGSQQVKVYEDSERAKAIIEAGFGKGANGCVTLVNVFTGVEIYCTGSCADIKRWGNGGVPILDHECCHACDYYDEGMCKYLKGAINDTCNSRPVPGPQTW
jgi:hypothetical protein